MTVNSEMTVNTVQVGNDTNSSYASTMGYELSTSGDRWQVENLNELYFDGVTSGNRACWYKA
jgi:hypothetical protein